MALAAAFRRLIDTAKAVLEALDDSHSIVRNESGHSFTEKFCEVTVPYLLLCLMSIYFFPVSRLDACSLF